MGGLTTELRCAGTPFVPAHRRASCACLHRQMLRFEGGWGVGSCFNIYGVTHTPEPQTGVRSTPDPRYALRCVGTMVGGRAYHGTPVCGKAFGNVTKFSPLGSGTARYPVGAFPHTGATHRSSLNRIWHICNSQGQIPHTGANMVHIQQSRTDSTHWSEYGADTTVKDRFHTPEPHTGVCSTPDPWCALHVHTPEFKLFFFFIILKPRVE